MRRLLRSRRFWLALGLVLFIVPFLLPGGYRMPVVGASASDWNHRTFWHHPWGRSGVHKGVDIFGSEGQPVVAARPGVVLYSGSIDRGGEAVVVLTSRWQLNYYAHLSTRSVSAGSTIGAGDAIGSVGSTGNAAGKQPHLHFSIVSLVPRPWRIRAVRQGWKRMFYLDPTPVLLAALG